MRVRIPILTALPEANFFPYLMVAMQPNVRTPARQRNAKRAGYPVRHNQIKISTSAKQRTEYAQYLWGKLYLFLYLVNVS